MAGNGGASVGARSSSASRPSKAAMRSLVVGVMIPRSIASINVPRRLTPICPPLAGIDDGWQLPMPPAFAADPADALPLDALPSYPE